MKDEKEAKPATKPAPEKPAKPERPIDETVEGGRYIVDGVEVNADGEPI